VRHRRRAPQGPPPAPWRRLARDFDEGLNDLWARAEQFTPGWESINLRLPNNDEAPLTFAIDHGMGGQPQKRANLTLNRQTGRGGQMGAIHQLQSRPTIPDDSSASTHTGEVLGVVGQTIAGIVTLWLGLSCLDGDRARIASLHCLAGSLRKLKWHGGRLTPLLRTTD
jgi:hypothetical protein